MTKAMAFSRLCLLVPIPVLLFSQCGVFKEYPQGGIAEIVIIDISESMRDAPVDMKKRVLKSWQDWASRAVHYPDSRFSALIAGGDISTINCVFRADVPGSWGPDVIRKKIRWRDSLESGFSQCLDSLLSLSSAESEKSPSAGGKVKNESDIVSCFTLAGELFQEMPAWEKRIVVISDMRQVSRGRSGVLINFECENTIPEPENFIRILKADSNVADLTGIQVTVYGMHNRSVSSSACTFSASQGQKVRANWERYFRESRAVVKGIFSEL